MVGVRNQSGTSANGKADGTVEVMTSEAQRKDRPGEVNVHIQIDGLVCVYFNARCVIGKVHY